MFRQNSYSIRRHIAKHENPELSSIGSHRIFRRKRHKIWYSGLCDRWRQQKMSFTMFNFENQQLQKISNFYVGTKMRESLAQKLHTQAEHLFHNNKTVHASRSASYLEWSAEFNLNFVPIRMLQFERFNMWKFCNQWSTVVEIVKPYTCGWWVFEMFKSMEKQLWTEKMRSNHKKRDWQQNRQFQTRFLNYSSAKIFQKPDIRIFSKIENHWGNCDSKL